MRGDEPRMTVPIAVLTPVFPTCVGMNRLQGWIGKGLDVCSPHAWG